MIKRLLATDERRLLHGCHRRFKKEIRKIYAISLLLNSEENYKKKNRELKKKKKTAKFAGHRNQEREKQKIKGITASR
jgi:hypothetical protein